MLWLDDDIQVKPNAHCWVLKMMHLKQEIYIYNYFPLDGGDR